MEKNKEIDSTTKKSCPIKEDYTAYTQLIVLDRLIDLEGQVNLLQVAIANCISKITGLEELVTSIDSNLKNINSILQRREAIRRNLGSGY